MPYNHMVVRCVSHSAADFGKSERSETRPGESCVEPVEPPIIQDALWCSASGTYVISYFTNTRYGVCDLLLNVLN